MAKSKYDEWNTEEGFLLIGGWAKDGLTDEQIAHNMGIAYSTFREWKKKHSALSAVLKTSKAVADRRVENALYESALGFHYTEDALTNAGEKVRLEKYEKPSTTAQIFWLKNRKREMWRDKQDHEVENRGAVTILNNTAEMRRRMEDAAGDSD